MRRQYSRQPLITEKRVVLEDKPVDNNAYDIKDPVPDFKDGPEVKTPTPYIVPPNESASKIYVPLIKNVIKQEELTWKDGYTYSKITEETTWKEFVLGGIELIKQKAGIVVNGSWKSQPFGFPNDGLLQNPASMGLCCPFTILGDGVSFVQKFAFNAGPKNPNFTLKDPMFTITNSMTIIFSGNHWGYAFLLRLIDNRIENAAGKYDPQVVCYSPTTHTIKVSCQGWYNWNLQKPNATHDAWYYNLSMRGEVDLLYDWNKLNKGGELVTIVTDDDGYFYKP